MDVTAIEKILPHRYPFLLVDRVVSLEPMKTLVAVKSVTVNEPFFAGHFPGHPVMPGVLILEALAQAAALLAKASMANDPGDKVTYLMAIDNARFRKPVVPGDRIELRVEVVKQKGAIWKEKGAALVDGEVVAEAEFMAMLVDRSKAE
ncbi:MAG TPA: 3-hydroxyacyl-ACP dehydratase FabZ [Anaeromyxobacteraceae bacterium]|nr:3-hydroxyacyl-ACP dehydratase FabZ [Anaeromyxobacteraceae bacterium]